MATRIDTSVMTANPTQAYTTIKLPSYSASPAWGYAIYPRTAPFQERSAMTRTLGAFTPEPRTTITLEPGFLLYFPFSVASPTVVTWPTLVDALTTVYPGNPTTTTPFPFALFYENFETPFDELIPIPASVFQFFSSGTIYIPLTVSPGTTIDMNPGIAVLRNAASATRTSIISSAGTSNSATPTSGENILTNPPIIQPTITPGPEDDDTPSTATLAGGIVGGVLAAILLCGLLGFFFVRRKRSKRSASATHAHASEKGDPNAPGTKSGMTGAQKQKMENTNPLVVEVAGSSAIPISDLWLAPEGGKPRWWQRLGTK